MTSSDPKGLAKFYDLFYSDPLLSTFYGDSHYANFGFWVDEVCSPHEACDKLVDVVVGQIENPAGSVLDVACGQGASTNRLSRYFDPSSIQAINLDPAQIEEAKYLFPSFRFFTMDAADLTFPDESFHNLVSIEAAFHFNTRVRFLQEAKRVLKPGGNLVMSDLLMAAGAPLMPEENHLADRFEYADLLERMGFIDVVVEDITNESWRSFRRAFTRFVSRDPKRMWDPLSWRSLYTLNVNSAWAVRACVLIRAKRPGKVSP